MNTPTKPNDGGPKAETKPETFELNSKTWFKHVPGDPRPCDPDAFVEVMFSDGDFGYHVGDRGKDWDWSDNLHHTEQIIGWRYADEQPEQVGANSEIQELEQCTQNLKKEISDCWDRVKPHYPDQVFAGYLPDTITMLINKARNQTQPWQPAPGDVVRLKSGGPKMTVRRVNETGCYVVWCYNNDFCSSVFQTACLELANKEHD